MWLICLWYAALLLSITWTAISWGSHSSCCLVWRKKCNVSHQRLASNTAGSFTLKKKEKEDVFFFLPMQPAGIRWLPCHFHKSDYFVSFCCQCSCSIHSKGETEFTQSQSPHSGSQLLLFYNHTITIFMRTPADGKNISLSVSPPRPPLPISPFLLWSSFFSVGLF